jgi:DNA mismatch endonuclease (patch repair protein)
MDKLSSERRSFNMSRIRAVDSGPELLLRRLLHALGYRYRLYAPNLPGRPDIVFTKKRKIIFVHGCFWHSHLDCRESHVPKTNLGYWGPKLSRNSERDRKNVAALEAQGWEVLILWECQLADRLLAERILRSLGPPRARATDAVPAVQP